MPTVNPNPNDPGPTPLQWIGGAAIIIVGALAVSFMAAASAMTLYRMFGIGQ